MRIYIPSKGRPLLQRTFERLPDPLKQITRIVVPSEEYELYSKVWGSEYIMGVDTVGIAPTRDYILGWSLVDGRMVMLDDDLIFQRLRPSGKIDNCSPDEVIEAFNWLNEALDDYVHAGFAVRFSDRGGGSGDKSPARMMHVLGYNRDAMPRDVSFANGATDPATFSMDDFNMTLQLLTQGIPNVVSNEWRTSPAAGNAKGGASTWRTLQTQNQSAHDLKRLFPDFVSLREKNNWQGIEGGQMFDVTVQWKRAYEFGAQTGYLGNTRLGKGTMD